MYTFSVCQILVISITIYLFILSHNFSSPLSPNSRLFLKASLSKLFAALIITIYLKNWRKKYMYVAIYLWRLKG